MQAHGDAKKILRKRHFAGEIQFEREREKNCEGKGEIESEDEGENGSRKSEIYIMRTFHIH